MMKKCLNLILFCCLILGLSSCKNSEKKKLPDKTTRESIVPFETIPSFQILLTNVDPAKLDALRLQPEKRSLADIKDPLKQAFWQGVKTAQLLIANKAGNDKAAQELYPDVVNNARISLNLEAKEKYLMQLGGYYRSGNKEKLDTSYDQLKKRIESDLWELNEHELYSVTILGEWCEATRILAQLFSSSPGVHKTYIDNDAWKLIEQNLAQIKKEPFAKSDAVKQSRAKAEKLGSVMRSAPEGKYDQASIDKLLKLADEIGTLYR